MPADLRAQTFAVATSDGVMRLRGALVFATARTGFDRLVANLPASGSSQSVDLSELAAADSAGLAVLVEWRTEAARRGVHLRYAGAGEGLRALARLADLDAELFR
jgi:ABC-type transporter Mla MlaB component